MSYLQDIEREELLVNRVKGLPLATIKNAIFKENGGREAAMARVLDKLGIEAIANLIAEGAMIAQIARGLNMPAREVSRYIHAHDGYDKHIPQAYEVAADMYVALANQELEDADLEKDSIARARARADHYMKLAAHFDRNRFGSAKVDDASAGAGVTYNIVIGDADALTPAMNVLESGTSSKR